MTRKEAINLTYDIHAAYGKQAGREAENIINKIFDDIEAQNAEILRTLHLLDSLSSMDSQTAIDELIKVL